MACECVALPDTGAGLQCVALTILMQSDCSSLADTLGKPAGALPLYVSPRVQAAQQCISTDLSLTHKFGMPLYIDYACAHFQKHVSKDMEM
jgi:hypothetical protein